ncbi:MAG: AtpZ/AtpI family protein [Sphingobacteriaceae bacterium]|nr:MAG: AtpZ/AtpI family protein [Sphingobacteriaceae bacterium]
MTENEGEKTDEIKKSVNNYAKYSTMGFQMIAIIGVFTYAGYKIDEANNHETKWVTVALALAGVFISLYLVIRSVKN